MARYSGFSVTARTSPQGLITGKIRGYDKPVLNEGRSRGTSSQTRSDGSGLIRREATRTERKEAAVGKLRGRGAKRGSSLEPCRWPKRFSLWKNNVILKLKPLCFMPARTCMLLWALLMVAVSPPSLGDTQVALGANANRFVCSLTRDKLDRSRTTWVRAFVPMVQFLSGSRVARGDKELRYLRSVAGSGRKVILSLKWNLKKAGWHVPAPGTPEEGKWFMAVDEIVRELQGQLAILSVINELYDDTGEVDLRPGRSGKIPFVEFQRRLVDHLRSVRSRDRNGGSFAIYTGGLTGVARPKRQRLPAMRAMLDLVQEMDGIAGLDFHLHADGLAEMEAALRFVRSKVTKKPIIVTEFSPVWLYKKHLSESIGTGHGGRAFANKYQVDAASSVADYIRRAQGKKVSEGEWQAFLKSRTWFDPGYLTRATQLMARFGVFVATYAFTYPESSPDIRPRGASFSVDTTPWLLNMLYVDMVAKGEDRGNAPVTYGLFDDYRRLQAPLVTACERQGKCPWDAKAPKQGQRTEQDCVF